MNIIYKKDKGFTLIELLVVVAIIGILATVGVVAYNGYTKSAKINATLKQHSIVRNSVQSILGLCDIGDPPMDGGIAYYPESGGFKIRTRCRGKVIIHQWPITQYP